MKLLQSSLLAGSITTAIFLTGCATSEKQAPVVDAIGPTSGLDLRDNFESKTLAQAEGEINDPSAYSSEEKQQLAKSLMNVKNVSYFGFDSFELTQESKENADKIAVILKDHPKQTLRITGHTDPRGSEEYNFNLGQKRATSLQDYLINQGVSPSQVCTVSYGELQLASSPEDYQGNAESAYQQDRRDVLEFGQNCSGSN